MKEHDFAGKGHAFEEDLVVVENAPIGMAAGFQGGETVNAQGWFRDPQASKTTNLSDGLEFVVGGS